MAQKMKQKSKVSAAMASEFAKQAREMIMDVIKSSRARCEWFDILSDEQHGAASIGVSGEKITIEPKEDGKRFRITHESGCHRSIDNASSPRSVQMLLRDLVTETQRHHEPDLLH